ARDLRGGLPASTLRRARARFRVEYHGPPGGPMKRVLAALAATLVVGLVATASKAESKGGTLVFGRGSDSITLDPPRAEDGESVAVLDNVFDSLVRYSDDASKIEPCLAEKWERSADGLTWTFELA